MWYDSFDTPIGPLTVATDVDGLRHVLFERNRHEVHGRSAWLHSPRRSGNCWNISPASDVNSTCR